MIAIVTGCPGQDSYYLVSYLLELDFQVIGTAQYSSTEQASRFARWDKILSNPNFKLETLDLIDSNACYSLVEFYKPDHLYNLAAKSHVHYSFRHPESVFQINYFIRLQPLSYLAQIIL